MKRATITLYIEVEFEQDEDLELITENESISELIRQIERGSNCKVLSIGEVDITDEEAE